MARKVVPSAAQIAASWANAMGSAATSQNYSAGIDRTVQNGVNPMALAATPEAEQAYQAGVQRSITSGKRNASLNAAAQNLTGWQNNAKQVGAPRLAGGAKKAQPKYQNAMNKWQPIYQQASDAAQALPQGGLSNAMARVQAALQVLMGAAGTA